MVRVDIWSDIACPWCLVGSAHLRAASKAAGIPVEVEMHSYQLNPDMTGTTPAIEHVNEKYGNGPQVHQMRERLQSMGEHLGIDFNFDTAVATNTFDGHRLHHFAKSKGHGEDMMEHLLKAQHVEGQTISDHATLQRLGEDAGLDSAEVATLLASEDFSDDVKTDMDQARQMGVTGVPFFVIDGKYGLSGAQPIEVMVEVLEKTLTKSA